MKSALEIGAEVIEHWYTLVPSQQFSSKEFYDHIEAGLKSQKVPALATSHVDLASSRTNANTMERRVEAKWQRAFDVLLKLGLVEATDAKGEILVLTHTGYELADECGPMR